MHRSVCMRTPENTARQTWCFWVQICTEYSSAGTLRGGQFKTFTHKTPICCPQCKTACTIGKPHLHKITGKKVELCGLNCMFVLRRPVAAHALYFQQMGWLLQCRIHCVELPRLKPESSLCECAIVLPWMRRGHLQQPDHELYYESAWPLC